MWKECIGIKSTDFCCWPSLTVGVDLTKFCKFCKKSWWNFIEGLIIIWQNFETILANLYDFGQICIVL